MRRLSYTDDAENDIVAIADYIAWSAQNISVGERFAESITQKCEKLATLPATMGRPRPELKRELRSIAFRGYVIFFRYVGDMLEVVNVLEGHRDIDAYFSENDE